MKNIKLNEYQRHAMFTALPSALNVPYMAYGLANEIGEFQGKIVKLSEGKCTKADALKELGDVLWYIAGVAFVHNWRLAEDIVKYPADIEMNVLCADFDEHGKTSPERAALILGDCGGEVLGKLKKQIRDGTFVEADVKELLEMTLRAAANAAASIGENISVAAQGNIEKLASRKARGVLGGNGDNR